MSYWLYLCKTPSRANRSFLYRKRSFSIASQPISKQAFIQPRLNQNGLVREILDLCVPLKNIPAYLFILEKGASFTPEGTGAILRN